MADLTVVILTMNEEKNIKKCIDSVKSIAKRILVIDSGSTDKTIDIAKFSGAEVYFREFDNYSKQFNWGLDNTNIDTLWVLRLDADEVIPADLAKEMIDEMLIHKDDDVNGMILKLKQMFMGRWLKHGGAYPFEKLMLFKNKVGRIEDRNMDEHTILSAGRTIKLKCDVSTDFDNVSYFVKH